MEEEIITFEEFDEGLDKAIGRRIKKMEIKIKNRKAIVTLTKNQFDYRDDGLIQYLANFCDEIEYVIIKIKKVRTR